MALIAGARRGHFIKKKEINVFSCAMDSCGRSKSNQKDTVHNRPLRALSIAFANHIKDGQSCLLATLTLFLGLLGKDHMHFRVDLP